MRRGVGQVVVYTLTVAKDHTFFVGAARVLVHNAVCSLTLRKIFTDGVNGSIRNRSIIAIRSTLLKGGFIMSKAKGFGYLFKDAFGEEMHIMRRNGGWDVRIKNRFGDYLDEFGNVASNAGQAHEITLLP